ncbi:phenylacetate--CoA ligase family protein [Plantactinospora sp. WMMB782]|uniref:phenylacetate--CoA ligase family protein n=1 Tax=Plantactinospora sp. WMMB782 TaxID=3404121 RepID=UPI003B95E0D9
MSRALPTQIPVLSVLGNLPRARAADRLSAQRVAQVQSRLLRRLVRHAYARVPYYRDSWDPAAVAAITGPADLAGLPALDRATVNAVGPAGLLADGHTVATTRAARTSGSSGMPVTLHYSERELGYLRASYLWDLLACGLRPYDRIGYFRVSGFRRHRLERLGLARNVHVDTSRTLDEQVEMFLAGRPTFLRGFPNAIASLVGELKRCGITHHGVRAVVFGGESLADAARAEVLEYFGATGHEVYASVEAHTIARSCPHGSLHLRSTDVLVEVEHDDGTVSVADGAGEILVTRLRSDAMPLVRYRLGDRVVIAPNDCPCGVRQTPVVRAVQGRVEDRIRTRDGRFRSGDFFASLLREVTGIRQFQFVQRDPGAVQVLIVPALGEPGPELARRARSALADAGADFEVSVRLVDRITPEANGKIRLVRAIRSVTDRPPPAGPA